ncbi:MAG: Na+/H+ antiporter NhaA [Sulfurimonas sp.]|nr:Na+/H+ antiporter NhaA [Sulfurimonas sp.]
MKMYAPWEKAFDKMATPFEDFIHAQTTTGLMLMLMTVIALVLANSPFAEAYLHFFHTKIDVLVGSWSVSKSIHHWINDGLMAIFFFIIGLEIKREILVGELSNIKVAMLPILSAIGGMLLPALIYISITNGTEGANGWGIPMATDIAFAISALVLLGKRVSAPLVTFLVALAIVDDLGAVVVIAIFYTEQINMIPLSLALISFLILVLFNRFGIHAVLPYFIVGTVMWLFMLESGVHATIAGVIAAMAIPSKPKFTPLDFTNHTKNRLDEYDNYPVATDYMMHEKQKAILQNIKDRIDSVSSPSARLEHDLHLPVSLLVIPLFALANAGISIDFSSMFETITKPVSLGIIAGLIFGKVLGIAGVAYLAIKLGIAKLPDGSSMSQVFGVAFLGGIGFTMSIFIADLAFIGNETLIFQAKIGILAASLIAGLFGFIWLRYVAQDSSKQ